MCGILGFFDTSRSLDPAELQRTGEKMAARLSHRGPDDQGLWQDSNLPLVLAHRRLSIIDLSPEGHQPKESASGRYVISFNGEIYNFQRLQKELEECGVQFKGRSDTEVMLAACDQWGVNHALQKFNGMFAFALWDKKTKKLHLVRDRLGKKPLYVGWAGKSLVFASELKAFHAHPHFRAAINRDTLALYMRYGWMPSPASIYDEVWQIPPGCRLSLDIPRLGAGQELQSLFEPYWHLPEIVAQGRQAGGFDDETAALGELEELLRACVQDRMISDVPLGAFLSGGIDSSAIVAMMQQLAARPVKTFTIGFEETGFDEAAYAAKVARQLGTDHHELYLKPQDALDVIPLLPEIYDEPFADASQIPTFLVSRFAREQVTVALTGDGGDEMFGGYSRHVAAPEIWSRLGRLPLGIRRHLASAIQRIDSRHWDRLMPRIPRFGDKLYKAAKLMTLPDQETLYRQLIQCHAQSSQLVIGAKPYYERLDDPAWQPQGLSLTEQLIYNDTLTYLPDDVLVKVDRAAMAASLECRAPLLDKRIAEFSWHLPLEMKVRQGQGKWLLRRLLARYLPEELFERPKQGFSVPIASWLQGPLKDWAETLLDETRLRNEGWLDPALIKTSWQALQAGKGEEAQGLWTILMFQAWLEKWQ